MTSQDAVRQLKEIAVEITEMSAEEAEEIWPWANGLADAADALRRGHKIKPYDESPRTDNTAGAFSPPRAKSRATMTYKLRGKKDEEFR